MESLRFRFQLSMLLLLCLAAVTFAAAEGSPLAAITIPIAVFSWLAVDQKGSPGIGPKTSLLLGLLALSAATAELLLGDIEARLLAPAHLLFYLAWIFLLQKKLTRRYWMLIGLSVLQLAIAALLTNSGWFGAALVAYAALALWTLGLFTIHRAVLTVTGGARDEQPAARSGRDEHLRRFAPSFGAASSEVDSAAPYDAKDRLIGWRFTGGAAVTTLVSLAITTLFFLLIPRVWVSRVQLFDNSPLAGTRPLTGFTEQVTLGDMGEILESDDLVLEIELFDEATRQPIDTEDYERELGGAEPLIRGQVLESYENGRWFRESRFSWNRARRRVSERDTLEQRIRLQPVGTPIIFGAGHVVTCVPEEPGIRIETENNANTYRRDPDADTSEEFDYIAYSSRRDPWDRGVNRVYREICLVYPRAELRPITRITEELLQETAAAQPLSDGEKAQRMLAFLQNSSEFSYSLDLSIQDPGVDPLVDFLINRKQGHCEYFASALTIMLRSQNIPSRMISGFKGGQLNSATGRYEVRQLHAHAWVEAFIDGKWQPLDPTPAGRSESIAAQVTETSALENLTSRWGALWNRGVRLSQAEQNRLIYSPLRDGFQTSWDALSDLRGTASRFTGFLRRLASSPQEWLSWRGGLTVALLLLLAFGLNALIRKLAGLVRFGKRRIDAETRSRSIPFYERFCRLSARAGFHRTSFETQQEFAHEVHDSLAGQPVDAVPPDGLPVRLTDYFYAVRFGGKTLGREEQTEVDELLQDYERTLQDFRSRRKAPPERAHPPS
mgnify:CR=1 FL=1